MSTVQYCDRCSARLDRPLFDNGVVEVSGMGDGRSRSWDICDACLPAVTEQLLPKGPRR